jgi:phage portal protein BeeE
MVLVLGILNRKEKRNKAGVGPRSEEKKERKAEKAKPIDRIDLYLLWV